MKRKKPTSKELQRVVENLIMEVMTLKEQIMGLSNGVVEYITFKKDTKKFENYLIKKEKVNARKKSSRKNTSGK
tara:strand:- start:1713 stop:1934 length:222 start_codon:yes stop_codon:yes gene_type:complete